VNIVSDSETTTSSSFSKSNGDSLLLGSVRYSTDLSEDSEAISDASEVVDRVAAEILSYVFESERRSGTYSESEDEVAAVTDTSGEERIRNTDWYVMGVVYRQS